MSRLNSICYAKIRQRIRPFYLNLIFFIVVLFVSLPSAVYAHSQPLKLEPAPGASLRHSPAEIRLTFSEPVRPNATISLVPQGSFTALTDVTAQQDPGNPGQIYASLPPLAPGTYIVQWQIESSDGHTLSGSYSFAVRASSAPSIWELALFFSLLFLLIGLIYRAIKKLRIRDA